MTKRAKKEWPLGPSSWPAGKGRAVNTTPDAPKTRRTKALKSRLAPAEDLLGTDLAEEVIRVIDVAHKTGCWGPLPMRR